MQSLPDAGPLPLIQPPPAGRAAAEAEFARQMPPRDPRVQHEQDSLQRLPARQPSCGPDSETAAPPSATAVLIVPTTRPTPPTAQQPSAPLDLTTDADNIRRQQAGPLYYGSKLGDVLESLPSVEEVELVEVEGLSAGPAARLAQQRRTGWRSSTVPPAMSGRPPRFWVEPFEREEGMRAGDERSFFFFSSLFLFFFFFSLSLSLPGAPG